MAKKKIKNKVEIADEKVVWRNFLFGLFQCYQGLEGNIDKLYWGTVNNNFEVENRKIIMKFCLMYNFFDCSWECILNGESNG